MDILVAETVATWWTRGTLIDWMLFVFTKYIIPNYPLISSKHVQCRPVVPEISKINTVGYGKLMDILLAETLATWWTRGSLID